MLKKRTLSLLLALSVMLSLFAFGGMIPSAAATIPDKPAGRPELATEPTGTDAGTIAHWEYPVRIEPSAGQDDYVSFGGFTGLTGTDTYVLKATLKVTAQAGGVWSGPELVFRTGADGTAYRAMFQGNCTYLFRGDQNFSATTNAGEFYTVDKAFTVAAVVTPQRTDIFMDGKCILSYAGTDDENYKAGTPAFKIYGGKARVLISDYSAYNAVKEKYVPKIPDGITDLATGIRANDGGNYFTVWTDPVTMNAYSGRDLYVDYAGFVGVDSADTYHLVFPLRVTAQAAGVWSGPEIAFRTDKDGDPYRLVLQGNCSYLFRPGSTDPVASAAAAGQFYTLAEDFTVELTVSPTGVEVLLDGQRILGYDPKQAGDTVYENATPCVRVYSGSAKILLGKATVWNTPHSHTAGEWETVTEPTATAAGEKVRRCTLCGRVVDRETLDKLPHDHIAGDWVTVTEPTATATGEKVRRCTVCSEIMDRETIDKLTHEHIAGDWVTVTEPTTTATGERVRRCTICDEIVDRETIDKLPHDHIAGDWVTVTEPTVTAPGEKIRRCTICDEITDRETIDKLPHTHVPGEWVTVTEPSVDAPGEKVRRCTICDEITDRETIDKLPQPLDPDKVPGMPKGAANLADLTGAAGDDIFTVKNGKITAKAAESGTLDVPVTPAGLEDSTYVLSFIVTIPADAEDWTGFEIVTNRSGDRTQSLIFCPNVIYLADNGQNQAECTNVKLPRGKECKVDIVFSHTEDGRLARRVFIDGKPVVNNWSGSSEMILDALAPTLQIRSRSSAYTVRQVRLYAADPGATEFEPDESDGGTSDPGDRKPEDGGSDPEKPDDGKSDGKGDNGNSDAPKTGVALPCAALFAAVGALAAALGSKKRRS